MSTLYICFIYTVNTLSGDVFECFGADSDVWKNDAGIEVEEDFDMFKSERIIALTFPRQLD